MESAPAASNLTLLAKALSQYKGMEDILLGDFNLHR